MFHWKRHHICGYMFGDNMNAITSYIPSRFMLNISHNALLIIALDNLCN